MTTRVLKPRPEREGRAVDATGADASIGFTGRVVIVAAVVALGLALWKAADVVLMGFGGVLLAIGLSAFADLLARRTPLGRRLALPVAIVTIVAVLSVLVWWIGGTIAGQFVELLRRLPGGLAKLQELLAQVGIALPPVDSTGAVEAAEPLLKLLGAARTTLGAAASALLVLVLGIYLAADPGLYRRGLLWLVPADRRTRVAAVLDASSEALRKWLGGQLVAMLAVGLVTWIGLAVLDVPLALSLAIIAMLLEFVPFIGPIAAAIPAILIAFTQGATTAIEVAVLYFAIQQLEGYLLTPLVQRWAVALPPALAVLMVVAFGVVFGIPGALLAVPLTVVMMVLAREVLAGRDAV
jgi:predicted PurR-regulated permease PerM